jgi:2-polyprenyl-6-methoxyphenol hydroxylase-like FAD-dependent oxidoreductase
MLANELALAGVDVVIVERRTSQELDGSRAGGLHARTIEVLDQRGIADRFLAEGQVMQTNGYGGVALDISDFPTLHNYGLALWQADFERILADYVLGEVGVPIRRGSEVVGLVQDIDGVDVSLAEGMSLRAEYVVGCDGGRSVVRKAAGIDFPGLEPSTSWMIAEVEMDEEPEFGFRRDSAGQHAIGRRQEHEPIRLVLTERTADHTGDPSMDELREALIGIYGTDFGLRGAAWISRFTDASRQAASYREGRVLLAGDAAHVHPPQGGQGMGIGVQDAVNLGWKLGQVVGGTSPDSLLDTYHAERHPIGARAIRHTMAQVALVTPDDRHQALREDVAELMSMDEPRRRFAGTLSGLDVHYNLGEGHPLLGRRMPDLDLATADGVVRVFALLHQARGVLLSFGSALGASAWSDRVTTIEAGYGGEWELPVLGPVAAPDAVLVRPDGYVAWVGDGTDAGLRDALVTWFGPR